MTEKIKALGDASGTALLELMDYYEVPCLKAITQEQAEDNYDMRLRMMESKGEEDIKILEDSKDEMSRMSKENEMRRHKRTV